MSNKTQKYMDMIDYFFAVSENSSDSSSVNQTWPMPEWRNQTIMDNEESKFRLLKLLRSMERNIHQINIPIKPDSCEYCEREFREVMEAYNRIHRYIILLICIIGVIANIINVAVLTRKEMVAASINRLLKWLAVADVFVMLEYVSFSTYNFFILPKTSSHPYPYESYLWSVYVIFHMHFCQILHTASIFLTLSLAIWRYIAIKYSDRSHMLCTERRCSIAILTSFILPPILCAPLFMLFHIYPFYIYNAEDEHGNPVIQYLVNPDYNGTSYQVSFWVHGVIIKLVPCFILTIISILLIRALYSANRHRKNLMSNIGCPAAENRHREADKRTDRTTMMLLGVLLLFLITELPPGILGLMSGLMGRCFFDTCYDLFGDLMDMLAMLNGAITFVLYCSMSQQFRKTFWQMVRQLPLVRWLGSSTSQ